VWQELRTETHPLGLEIVSVGLDAAGADACRPFIERAAPEHPSLIDRHHVMAEAFGVVNIPNSVWIDENGMIVRPAEAAPPPRREHRPPLAGDVPGRLGEIMAEAAKIRTDPDRYHQALQDWIIRGSDSEFALDPDTVVARSRPRTADAARGAAHFELATHLESIGRHDRAIEHFRQAHRLVPDNFGYKRQAWSLEPGPDGASGRFWQGPSDADPDAWPYDGDWLTDVRAFGAEHYYPEFRP
jgi:tetratricopeptide (TPR) repeat protein